MRTILWKPVKNGRYGIGFECTDCGSFNLKMTRQGSCWFLLKCRDCGCHMEAHTCLGPFMGLPMGGCTWDRRHKK